MKMNIYEGHVTDRSRFVTVNDEYLLYPSDQPYWSYVGAGPARVAEAIMINELGREVDRALVNLFLEQVVAKWPGREGWVMTSQQIKVWQEKAHV
jgi:hypothetical protein